MLMLEWVLVLLLAAVVLTTLAERLAVPYPSLLAIAGAGLAFLPFAPPIRIESELALALFVAPALLDAAFDTSPRGLRDNAIPVASMAVVAVVLTTAAIAFLGCRFADRRGNRPWCDRGPARCGRSQRGATAPADSAADRARVAGREYAQRRDRAVDLSRRRSCSRGFIQPRRRRANPGARGCGGPGRWLCARATVSGRKRVRARPSQRHRSAIRQHVWGVASVRAPGACQHIAKQFH